MWSCPSGASNMPPLDYINQSLGVISGRPILLVNIHSKSHFTQCFLLECLIFEIWATHEKNKRKLDVRNNVS